MDIEKEAEDFTDKKNKHFLYKLDMLCQDLELFLTQSLHNSEYRDHALKKLQETRLWAKFCKERHGLK
jgi:queuine/archaeosine tRNA-ribosyltransferase